MENRSQGHHRPSEKGMRAGLAALAIFGFTTPACAPLGELLRGNSEKPVASLAGEQEAKPNPTHEISRYIEDYLKNDWAKEDFGDKKWQVTQVQELVTISVTDVSGINIRNFPDVNVGTNEIPTGKQPPEAQYKRLKFDPAHPYTEGFTLFNEGIELREIPGAFLYFISVEDPITKDVSIWAIHWSKDGGWINTPQPHLETFAVYHNQEWLVSFKTADGNKPISGEELFEKAAPSIFLPKAQELQLQEPTITSPK